MTAGAENLGKSGEGDFRTDSPQPVIGQFNTIDTPHTSQPLIGSVDPVDKPKRRRTQPTPVLPVRKEEPATAVFVPEVQESKPVTIVPLIRRADEIQVVEPGRVEGDRPAEAIDPHEKPVTWFLDEHEGEGAEELAPFKAKIVEELFAHPEGNVAVFTENGLGLSHVTEMQTELVALGFRPSEAVVEATIRTKFPDGLEDEAAERERQKLRAQIARVPFYNAQLTVLDSIFTEFPSEARRIVWIEEGNAPEEVNRIDRLVNPEKYPEAETNGDMQERTGDYFAVRIENLRAYAEGQRVRDTAVIQRNKRVLEDPSIAAVVGSRGVHHQIVVDHLRNEGYSAQMPGEGYIHDPESLIALRLIEDPDTEITHVDILLIDTAHRFAPRTHPDGTPLTTQERNKQMNAFVATTKAMMGH